MHETIEQALEHIGTFMPDYEVRCIRMDIESDLPEMPPKGRVEKSEVTSKGVIEVVDLIADHLDRELPEDGLSSRGWRLLWEIYQNGFIDDRHLEGALEELSAKDYYVRRYRVHGVLVNKTEEGPDFVFEVSVKANERYEAQKRAKTMKDALLDRVGIDRTEYNFYCDPDVPDEGNWDVESEDEPQILDVRREE